MDMRHENKPNSVLNVLCFVLPFPIAFFFPPLAWLLIFFIFSRFINDPTGHLFLKTLPAAYIVFAIVQFIVARKFASCTSSPRSKSAAQSLLYSVSFIAVFVVLTMGYLLLNILFRH